MPLRKNVVHIPLSYAVPAATETTITDKSPVTGTVLSITVHFPDGCNALVSIVCYVKASQVLPVNNTIALNNATTDFDVNRPVSQGDDLKDVISNRYSANPHTPSIVFNIEGDYAIANSQ